MKTTTYETITQQILAMLDKGVAPWRKTWKGVGRPVNIKGNRYRGANFMLLAALDFERPIFLTYKQAQEHGGNVRKGEKGIPVVFWKTLQFEKESDGGEAEGEGEKRQVPFMRHYTVFNVSQCDGVKLPAKLEQPTLEAKFDPVEAAERICAGYPNPPKIRTSGERACYNLALDEIAVPPKTAFESAETYYATLFHEMGHSTGHKSRLDRTMSGNKHGDTYALEELIAEMTATFLCAEAGIEQPVLENAAAYLEYWGKQLKADPKLFVTAAGRAQKAADYILNVKHNEQTEEVCA